MTIKNKTTNIYTEWKPLVDGLPDNEAGKIFKAIFAYQSNETVECDNPVWLFIKSKIDTYNEQGEQISKVRSEAGKKGMASRWGITNDNKCYQEITSDNKNNNKIKEKKIKQNNTIPSLQEVIDYCKERNNFVDPNKWFDFYSANGWKVGKNPMKDWRACVRNWERNSSSVQPRKETTWEHNMRVMKEMEAENANESLF